MGLLDRPSEAHELRRRKEKVEVPKKEVEKNKTEVRLEDVCGDNKEVYQALCDIVLLNPNLIVAPEEAIIREARELEKQGDILRAKFQYQLAGQLAIYKGDVEKVKKYFRKCAKLSKRPYPILDVVEEAVTKAQEYYKLRHIK